MTVWLTATGFVDASSRWRRSEYLGVADAKSVEQARKLRKERRRAIFVLSYEMENGISKGCMVGIARTTAYAAPSYMPSYLSQ